MARKQRATSEIVYKSTRARSVSRSVAFKALWADPVRREQMLAQRRATRALREHTYKPRSRMGVPDGMRKAEAMALWDKAKVEANRFIEIMTDAGNLPAVVVPGSEEEMAKETLRHAYEMAVGPLTDAKTKAAYLRIVLDFTKSKPETKSKLSLENSAEWLAALSADMPKADGNSRTE